MSSVPEIKLIIGLLNWQSAEGNGLGVALPNRSTLGRGCLEVVRVWCERWINSNLFVISNSDCWAFDLPIDRVNLVPPWNDKGVEDGARIITRKGGIDAHDEGGKSNEEVKSPHYTVIHEMIFKYCMRHAYSISLLQYMFVVLIARPRPQTPIIIWSFLPSIFDGQLLF